MITHLKASGQTLTQRLPDEHYLDEAWSASDVLAILPDAGLEVGYWEFEGDQRIPPQGEGFLEVFVIVEGSGVFSADGEIVRVETGDILIVRGPTGMQRMWSAGLKTAFFQRPQTSD